MSRGDEPEFPDKRRHHRGSVTLVVAYDGAEELVRDFSENLSTGGIFVQTPRDLPVGTEVQLSLSFPGLVRPITLGGVVRWARSEPEEERGVGIEFADYSPEVRDELASIVRGIASRDPELVTPVLRILLVEDNPHVAQLIRDGLQGSARRGLGEPVSFEFVTAGNGREALDYLETGDFDVLIIDIYLPVLDGTSVITAVRADPRISTVPIIAVSAGGATARLASFKAGADFFLDKPMRLKDILATMQRLIAIRREADE